MLSDAQIVEATEKQNFWLIQDDKWIKIIHMPKLWSEQPELKLLLSKYFHF